MIDNRRIDPIKLFAEIEKDREMGKIRRDLFAADPCYQSSKHFPGFIERIFGDGKKDVGLFVNGEFRVDLDKTDK